MRRQETLAVALTIMMAIWAACPSWAASHKQAQTAYANAGHSKNPVASNPSRGTDQDSNGFLKRRPRYRVEPGDVLALEFPFTPELNQTVTIQPDGYISLSGVGDYYAKGKTTKDLSAGIETAYGKILKQPVVTVDLKNFQEPYFVVGGQVGHPGKYNLRAPTTVVEALAIAGGLTPASKHSQILLFRRVNASTFEVKKLNVKKMLLKADMNEDVTLRPGDMLYVPQNTISKISRFLPSSAMGMYFSPPKL